MLLAVSAPGSRPRVSSAPNTVAIPASAAAFAACTTPGSPSWSTSAIAPSPSRAAWMAMSSGLEAPSRKLKWEWACSSAYST